jgi:hypothetical protein
VAGLSMTSEYGPAAAPGSQRWWRAGLRRLWRGQDIAVIYAAIVVLTTIVVAVAPRRYSEQFVLASSSNLANLRIHPPVVLLLSAFMQPAPIELPIVVLLIWIYGALQRWLGRAATVITAVFGHVGATLFVAASLTAGIAHGHIAVSAAHVADVGVSYGLVAAAGVLTAHIRRRRAYTSSVTVALVALLAISRTFTDLGHLVAWAIGLCLAILVAHAQKAQAQP